MKALVLAAAIVTSDLETPRSKPRDSDRRAHAERNRYTERELQDMFGDMEPEREPTPPPDIPERDFIGWAPDADRRLPDVVKPIAA